MIEIALNMYINLEWIDIFTIWGLPLYKHGISLHLFRCYSITVLIVGSFSAYILYMIWLIYTQVFHFLDDYKWCYVLILISTCLLLVHKNAINFCIFISCPLTLLNSLISSRTFYCRFIGIFYTVNHVIWR